MPRWMIIPHKIKAILSSLYVSLVTQNLGEMGRFLSPPSFVDKASRRIVYWLIKYLLPAVVCLSAILTLTQWFRPGGLGFKHPLFVLYCTAFVLFSSSWASHISL